MVVSLLLLFDLKESPFGDRGIFLINKDLCNAFLVFVLQFCSFHS
jgi:hypothetical protein